MLQLNVYAVKEIKVPEHTRRWKCYDSHYRESFDFANCKFSCIVFLSLVMFCFLFLFLYMCTVVTKPRVANSNVVNSSCAIITINSARETDSTY